MKAILHTIFYCAIVCALPHVTDGIIGGSEASKGEFPHVILMQVNRNNFCGGSIVNENWIVTAAHCAEYSIQGYTLVAGEHNLNDEDEGTEQFRNVSEIIVHPNFDLNTLANDIALMKVNTPFTLNNYVPIPNSSFTPANMLTATGWGALSSGGDPFPANLMKVHLPLVDTETCRQGYGSELLDGMLCAGAPGKGTCQGDNGCPLMSGDILAGIVSWGYGCGLPQYPGVYTELSTFSSWIESNID